MLTATFKLVLHSLLQFKKDEGLVYNEYYTIAEINEITDSTSNMKVNNCPKISGRQQKSKISKNYTLG